MSSEPALRYTDDECRELFARLFPGGFGGADVLSKLAPEGWEKSPLNAVFHPSPERVHEETVRMHENMRQLFASRKEDADAEVAGRGDEPPPTLEQIRADHKPQPIEPERELRDLVGMCLWDVFSDNHEVLGPDGRVADLGSFRASAGFLADVVNHALGHPSGAAEALELERIERLVGVKSVDKLLESLAEADERQGADRVYSYLDFYLGTQMVAGRADLSPVYRLIFMRLKALSCDWRYHFPRLMLVDMRPLRDALDEGEPDWTDYDPSAELAKEQADQERDAELAKMRADMDAAHRESVEAALSAPPPPVVCAYSDVYGELPEGWPPTVDD